MPGWYEDGSEQEFQARKKQRQSMPNYSTAPEKVQTADISASPEDGYARWRSLGEETMLKHRRQWEGLPDSLREKCPRDIAYFEELLIDAFAYSHKITAQLQSANTEIATLKGAMAAQDERERIAAERLGMTHTCDWPDEVADALHSANEARIKVEQAYRDLDRETVSIDALEEITKIAQQLKLRAEKAEAALASSEPKAKPEGQ